MIEYKTVLTVDSKPIGEIDAPHEVAQKIIDHLIDQMREQEKLAFTFGNSSFREDYTYIFPERIGPIGPGSAHVEYPITDGQTLLVPRRKRRL